MSNLYRLCQRLTAHYALIQSTFNMAYCCIMSFAAVFLLSRGFSNSEVGLCLTIANGLAIVCQPFIAAFADKDSAGLEQLGAIMLYTLLLPTRKLRVMLVGLLAFLVRAFG